MLRFLLHILSAVSLLMFVAIAALWVRSYWIIDTAYHVTDRAEGPTYVARSKMLLSNRGAFTLVRSGRWESMDDQPDYAKRLLASRRGGIQPETGWATSPAEDLSEWSPGEPNYGALGFRWRTYDEDKQFEVISGLKRIHNWARELVIPDWALLLTSAGLPLFWIRRRLRLRRRAGVCVSCGYDLRATPGRCPECGNVPAKI